MRQNFFLSALAALAAICGDLRRASDRTGERGMAPPCWRAEAIEPGASEIRHISRQALNGNPPHSREETCWDAMSIECIRRKSAGS